MGHNTISKYTLVDILSLSLSVHVCVSTGKMSGIQYVYTVLVVDTVQLSALELNTWLFEGEHQ